MTILAHPRTAHQLGAIGVGSATLGYIFHGPTGIGKATSAIAVARRLNCAAGGQDNCAICHQVDAGTYPNLVWVAPADKPSITVEQIRELGRSMAMRTYSASGMRVVIIDRAHTMTAAAQNALLKLIEEPPEATLFILITPTIGALLPTVTSRLGAVFFAPVEQSAMVSWLMANRNASSMDAVRAANSAEGRPGVAVQALEAGTDTPDTAVAAALALTTGTTFARLVEAARIAAAKADGALIANVLHHQAATGLRAGELPPGRAAEIMEAAEQIRRYLGANVTLRSCLERFVLETA